MSDKTAIGWTNATWNPTTGCTKVSPECAHCYIDRTPPFRTKGRKFVNGHIPLQLHSERLEQPLHWPEPRMVFVDSLSDLFHSDVPDDFVLKVVDVMERAHWHTFQVLTKRPDRMLDVLGGKSGAGLSAPPLPNVWWGVSAGNRRMWQKRVPLLLQLPAAVRFVSIEPCLENMVDELFTICLCSGWNLPPYDDKIDWLIVGGESGPKRRPFELAWLRRIVEAARTYDTPIFVKQDTAYRAGERGRIPDDLWIHEFPTPRLAVSA